MVKNSAREPRQGNDPHDDPSPLHLWRLPLELLSWILSYLQVRSVLALKCANKPLRSLLSLRDAFGAGVCLIDESAVLSGRWAHEYLRKVLSGSRKLLDQLAHTGSVIAAMDGDEVDRLLDPSKKTAAAGGAKQDTVAAPISSCLQAARDMGHLFLTMSDRRQRRQKKAKNGKRVRDGVKDDDADDGLGDLDETPTFMVDRRFPHLRRFRLEGDISTCAAIGELKWQLPVLENFAFREVSQQSAEGREMALNIPLIVGFEAVRGFTGYLSKCRGLREFSLHTDSPDSCVPLAWQLLEDLPSLKTLQHVSVSHDDVPERAHRDRGTITSVTECCASLLPNLESLRITHVDFDVSFAIALTSLVKTAAFSSFHCDVLSFYTPSLKCVPPTAAAGRSSRPATVEELSWRALAIAAETCRDIVLAVHHHPPARETQTSHPCGERERDQPCRITFKRAQRVFVNFDTCRLEGMDITPGLPVVSMDLPYVSELALTGSTDAVDMTTNVQESLPRLRELLGRLPTLKRFFGYDVLQQCPSNSLAMPPLIPNPQFQVQLLRAIPSALNWCILSGGRWSLRDVFALLLQSALWCPPIKTLAVHARPFLWWDPATPRLVNRLMDTPLFAGVERLLLLDLPECPKRDPNPLACLTDRHPRRRDEESETAAEAGDRQRPSEPSSSSTSSAAAAASGGDVSGGDSADWTPLRREGRRETPLAHIVRTVVERGFDVTQTAEGELSSLAEVFTFAAIDDRYLPQGWHTKSIALQFVKRNQSQ
ncbi:unnamed protein product [Vitrella brassicaformis CCMP3155]|uniref:F-box domain-containing protein n=3 Tax=Vitrella brassicaformis TaxID=1169539 RepID=A0A0G4FZW4_VITBC|nr:unnamed protein product [Vitrella brassicaformis CCMP3155]|eukprot:CEM21183.1 unnamed protein product [Vitrella brassicaformis CCMP3155]